MSDDQFSPEEMRTMDSEEGLTPEQFERLKKLKQKQVDGTINPTEEMQLKLITMKMSEDLATLNYEVAIDEGIEETQATIEEAEAAIKETNRKSIAKVEQATLDLIAAKKRFMTQLEQQLSSYNRENDVITKVCRNTEWRPIIGSFIGFIEEILALNYDGGKMIVTVDKSNANKYDQKVRFEYKYIKGGKVVERNRFFKPDGETMEEDIATGEDPT